MKKLVKNLWFWVSIILVIIVAVMGINNMHSSGKDESDLRQENKRLKEDLANLKKDRKKVSSSSSKGSSTLSDKDLKIGQSVQIKSGGHAATVTVTSVKKVDPSFNMVSDVSENHKDLNQFVIVNYTVKCEKGPINMAAFDGAQLVVADSNGVIGKCSSGRDEAIQTLDEGKTADLRIGWGLKSNDSKVTVKIMDYEWAGDITQ